MKLIQYLLLITVGTVCTLILLSTWICTQLGIPPNSTYYISTPFFSLAKPYAVFTLFATYFPLMSLSEIYEVFILPIFLSLVFLLGFKVLSFYLIFPSTSSSTRFAKAKTLKKKSCNQNNGIILGRLGLRHILTDQGEGHVLCVAPTRSGKGVGVVIPTLFNWKGSVVVYDIKGENWRQTAGFRSKFSNCIYFNPIDPKSAKFNPLQDIDPGPTAEPKIDNLAHAIIDPDGSGYNRSHWYTSAQLFLSKLLLFVLHFEEDKSIGRALELLGSPDVVPVELYEKMVELGSLPECPSSIKLVGQMMLNKGPDEQTGIQSTTCGVLAKFLSEIVRTNLASNDFSVKDLQHGSKPLSLYLCIPTGQIENYRPIVNVLLKHLFQSITDDPPDTEKKHQVLFLIDEFPTLGKLPFLETGFGVLAGYGIRFLLIAQSLSQIKALYGHNSSILENCASQIFYCPNSPEHIKTLSDSLGKYTSVSRKTTKQQNSSKPLGKTVIATTTTLSPVMSPKDILNLKKTRNYFPAPIPILSKLLPNQAIPFIRNNRRKTISIILQLLNLNYMQHIVVMRDYGITLANSIRYFDDPLFKDLALPPPPIPNTGPYPYGTDPKIPKWPTLTNILGSLDTETEEVIPEEPAEPYTPIADMFSALSEPIKEGDNDYEFKIKVSKE